MEALHRGTPTGGANSGMVGGSRSSESNERWSACACVNKMASSAGSFSSAMPGGDTRGRIRPSFGSKFGSVRSLAPPSSNKSVAWPM